MVQGINRLQACVFYQYLGLAASVETFFRFAPWAFFVWGIRADGFGGSIIVNQIMNLAGFSLEAVESLQVLIMIHQSDDTNKQDNAENCNPSMKSSGQ